MPRSAFVVAIGLLSLGAACIFAVSGAWAGETDPYTVSGVPVDASAASASVAQNIAINGGRSRAWSMLYRKLTKAQDWPRQPTLDDSQLQRMVRDYRVVNERRSTTRFVASMTYVFNAESVRRLLRSQNIPFVDVTAKPVLVVALSPGYSSRSAWAMALANPRYQGGEVPMLPPAGDHSDDDALGGLDFDAAQWSAVQPSAARVHATDVFLARLSSSKGQLTISLRRLGTGTSAPIPDVVVDMKPGETPAAAMAAAADAATAAIAEAWKSRSAIDFNKRLRLTADVRIESLSDWGAVLQRLGQIPTVSDVNVVAMNTGEARIAITYVGTAEQLQTLAGQNELNLSNADGTWQLGLHASGAP